MALADLLAERSEGDALRAALPHNVDDVGDEAVLGGILLAEGNRDLVILLPDHDRREVLKELRELAVAERADVEIRVLVLELGADLAGSGRLALVVVLRDDIDDVGLDGLLVGAAPCGFIFKEVFKLREDRAGRAEGIRGLLLAHADDDLAGLAEAARQAGEIAVRRDDAEPVHIGGVEEVHRVDDEGRVGGIFAGRVRELLDRDDRPSR